MDEKDVFERYADSYTAQVDQTLGRFGANQDLFTRHKAWLIKEILARGGRDPSAMSLLDVGCGIGSIHGLLRGNFREITGTDVSTASLRVAAGSFGDISYEAYDGKNLPYEDGRFDMAMAICVFHHIPPAQWQQVAQDMVRVVKKGGLILIIEHNPFNPVTRYIVNSCPIDKDAVLLTPRRMRGLFDIPGTLEVSTRAVLAVPPVSDFLRRLDLMVGVFPLGAQYYMTAVKAD